jgi:hypothetical protein
MKRSRFTDQQIAFALPTFHFFVVLLFSGHLFGALLKVLTGPWQVQPL